MFKNRTFPVVALAMGLLLGTDALAQNRYTIVLDGLGKEKGTLMIAWYNSATTFPSHDKALFFQRVTVEGKDSATVDFENITSGKYAIAAFLDENGDGKLSTNFMGIPKERYGFSNNVRPAMRAARFEEAAFEVDGDGKMVIRLR